MLLRLARTRLRTKTAQLQEAFAGRFGDHQAFLLARMLGRIDQASADTAELDRRIEAELAPFAAAADRLDAITGVGRTAAQVLIARLTHTSNPAWTRLRCAPPGAAAYPLTSNFRISARPSPRRRAGRLTASRTWQGDPPAR